MDAGDPELEVDLIPRQLDALGELSKSGEPELVGVDRLLVAAGVLLERASLPGDACLEDRVVRNERADALVGARGARVVAEALADVPEALRDRGHVDRVERVDGAGRLERALVQLGRDDVREARLCPPPGGDRVAPRAREVVCRVEVERQECRLLVGTLPEPPLDRRADGSVDLGAAAERETFVRGDADEVVPEGEAAVACIDEKLAQGCRKLELVVGRAEVGEALTEHGVGHDLPQQTEIERRPDDGGVSQHHAVDRVERVDPCGQQPLDGVGQRVELLAVACRPHELPDEERVAARTLDERAHRLVRQRRLLRNVERERGRSLDAEGLELEARDVLPLRGRLAVRSRGDAHEPGPRRRSRGQRAEQEARGVVQPVPVLDDEERRHEQHPLQERADDLVQPVEARACGHGVHLGRVRHLGVERHREQREHRGEVGHGAADERRQDLPCLRTPGSLGDADEAPQ